MPRVHFKSFAFFPLITILVAAPAMAASPGNASRRAAARSSAARQASPDTASQSGGSGVQNALGLLPFGGKEPVRQVVGKQPSAPAVSPNRSLSLLPALFGGSPNTAPAPPAASSRSANPRSGNDVVQSRGILNDIFGSRPSPQSQPVEPNTTAPANIDWQGIPYHQARSKSPAAAPTPIRDPRPNETRLAGPSTLASRPTPTATDQQVNPAIPQPPALAPAPTSRRASPAMVAASSRDQDEATPLSPLSSSRRSDRRDIPALDASEIAAAQKTKATQESLVPKVTRKVVKVEPQPSTDIAKTSPQPVSQRRTSPQPNTTPAIDVAMTPQPTATSPAADPIATRDNTMPATVRPDTIANAEPTLPAAVPSAVDPSVSAVASVPSPSDRLASTAPAPQTQTTIQPPAPQSPEIAAAPAPTTTPQFVAPRLPLPASPQFGPNTSVAGHRMGPPASAFQARTQPRATLSPASMPFAPAGAAIGSGVQPSPQTATYPATESFASENDDASLAPPQRIAQNPYGINHDPYAATSQPDPSITYGNSALGAPQASATSAMAHTPQLPPSAVDSPTAYPTSETGPANSHLQTEMRNQQRFNSVADQPFPVPAQPRSVGTRNATSELPAGQTAVASELPGIRVITHGPSSVIIRQTHEFEIRVENRGAIDAVGVMVRAVVPQWADVKGQNATRGEVENQLLDDGDRLVWTIDSLPAGTTEKLFVRLQAMQSGTHGLDVDWTLLPQKSVATIEVREPKLDLVIEGPEEVVYGESQSYKVRVLNPGDGVAPNVVFTLSPNSSTPQTQRIGDIPSGKEAQFEVELTAQDLGDLKIHGLAAGDLGLKAEAEKAIRVSAAELEAVLAGPEIKYQNTDAMYHLQLTNKGSATCKNITANLALPPGIRYLGGIEMAKKLGTRLSWEIESLPPGATREYEFHCTMVSPGTQTFDFAANGSAAGQTSVALDTQVDSIADLVMTIQDPAAPAPVGTEVVYEILIKNRGSRQANGVRAIAQFSNGIEPRRIEGHSGQVLTGQVLFDPIETIRPGQEIRIRVIAEAESEGHHRFRTEIRSGETVLVAEEATQFLSKRSERVSRRSSVSSPR